MNKRITSILLCFVMLFGMLVSAVPAYAAPVNPPMIYIEPDKTEANRGDTITYKFYLQQPDTMTAFAFNIVVPDGLTCIADSGTLGSSASAAWGSTFEWVPDADLQLQWYSSSGDDVTDTSKIELLTIKFTVDDDATIGAEYEVSLKNMQLAAGSTQYYDDISSTVEVSTTKVNVVAKPVAVTGVTIDETLSLKTGESKTPSYTVNPAEATNKTVSFKSDNTAVATVNETTGEVTGVKEGTATITITTADGNFTDTCVVTVACSHANKTPVAEKPSDCKNKGWDAYVKCDDCGQLFAENGTTEIAEIPFRALSSNHTGGTATCTAKAVCTVCSQPYGDFAPHSYTAETKKAEALKTAGNCRDVAVYFYSCSACGKVENNDSHTFNGDKDANTHVGGTHIEGNSEPDHKNQVAGSTGATICDGCGTTLNPATPIAPGAHTPAGVWSTDGQYHWKECTVVGCGIVIDGSKVAHSSTGANVATCQKPAVCDVCGVSYGTVADHDWNTSSWEKDASGHWHKCNTAGCTEKNDFARHSSTGANVATCVKQAVCDVCSATYGETLQHNYGTEKAEEPAEIGKDGIKAHYQCSECQKYFVDVNHDTYVEKKEVTYNELRIPALVDEQIVVEIPFSVIVKKTGEVDPTKETFTFKMFDLGFVDTVYTVEGLTVETNGVNNYTGKLVIKVKESQFDNLSEGFKFAQIKGTSDDWTYDETVYYIAPQMSPNGATSFVVYPGDDAFGNSTLEKVEFTNSYKADKVQKPVSPENNDSNKPTDDVQSPQTGDNSMIWLWFALLFVSGFGAVVTTVLVKKRSVR